MVDVKTRESRMCVVGTGIAVAGGRCEVREGLADGRPVTLLHSVALRPTTAHMDPQQLHENSTSPEGSFAPKRVTKHNFTKTFLVAFGPDRNWSPERPEIANASEFMSAAEARGRCLGLRYTCPA